MAVDTLRHLLVSCVTADDEQDREQVEHLLIRFSKSWAKVWRLLLLTKAIRVTSLLIHRLTSKYIVQTFA